jgi:hypothetical protein
LKARCLLYFKLHLLCFHIYIYIYIYFDETRFIIIFLKIFLINSKSFQQTTQILDNSGSRWILKTWFGFKPCMVLGSIMVS